MATISQATMITAAIAGSGKASMPRTRVNYISGLNSFGGLKAQNNVVSLGLPVSTEHCFAKIVSSVNDPSLNKKGRGGGGALSSTCSAAISEIFRIAAIIPGLVLVGVAVGFVLLRIEATVEESE
ncbi:OLC1v1003077C3 [Oldenlandia corymbosa var. corymbosa]|uniref:OLC1v1003077C3 n=1 Tax=Oldenlandia corymbosa var. corymbosa TaxID=529605 RepID=A0AAV1DCL4_OLDCO|nr:OLC1v1003077C3 [Oldenlandia corymbosa var. corymbosa]